MARPLTYVQVGSYHSQLTFYCISCPVSRRVQVIRLSEQWYWYVRRIEIKLSQSRDLAAIPPQASFRHRQDDEGKPGSDGPPHVKYAHGRQIYARVMSEASVYSSEPRWWERGNPCFFAPEFSTVTVLHQGPSDDPVRLDHRMRS